MTDPITPRELKAAYPYMFEVDAEHWKYEFYQGWFALVVDACHRINALVGPHPYKQRFAWVEMREKFGSLRLYWRARGVRPAVRVNLFTPQGVQSFTNAPAARGKDGKVAEAIRAAVDEVMAKSTATCCVCGGVGTLRSGDWWITLCDQHNEMREGGMLPSAAFAPGDK